MCKFRASVSRCILAPIGARYKLVQVSMAKHSQSLWSSVCSPGMHRKVRDALVCFNTGTGNNYFDLTMETYRTKIEACSRRPSSVGYCNSSSVSPT